MSESLPAPTALWKVGSSPQCDIVVDRPVVTREHCRLSLHGDQYVLEDLGSRNGTFVNGYRLEPGVPVYVSSKDQITLGRELPMPWPPTPQAAGQRSSTTQAITIGRGPHNDIQIEYPMVSWDHARITRNGGQLFLEDLRSANGTAINQIENKIQRPTPLQATDDIYLGSYKIAASRILQARKLTQGDGQFALVPFKGERMVLGRDPSCDYPLNYPMISWRHAALERASNGIYVEDLGSRNGTYVNGVRIAGRTLVRPGEEIGLGSFRFQLLEDGSLARREYIGNVTIEATSVVVNTAKGLRLLDPVSLTIFPSELVALMGPAGAGKTTLLKAMNGYTRPAAGSILFNGHDLYQFYDRFRLQMSYVPQDDIVHAELKVREALYFSAKLRTDLKDDEIQQRIEKVLSSLDIWDKRDTIIGSPERKVLSGGQRKRVNIAMELIPAAPVIFLDEPTSGLSSYDAEQVIQLLKQLAREGTTIITTIHQPSLAIFKQFDNLIMISRDPSKKDPPDAKDCGALAYFGPAHPDSIEFFDPAGAQAVRSHAGHELNPEMLLSGLKKKQTAEWVATYEQSRYKKLFVDARSGKVPSSSARAAESPVRAFGFGQWRTLVHRNFLLKLRDRAQSIILLIQAPLFAILLGAVFGSLDYTNPDDLGKTANHALGIEFLMVVAAVWFGCNNVARDIVGERTVFQRERMVSLKLPSYIFSKLTVAAILSFFQCFILLGMITLMCDLKGNFAITLGILYLSSLVGAAIGLWVSAWASTTEAAIAVLPLVLLPVITLGGGLSPIYQMRAPVRQIAMIVPSRWAFEADLELEAQERHGTTGSDLEQKCDLAEIPFPSPEPTCPANYSQRDNTKQYSRTPLKTTFTVLCGMLVFWLGMALLFLRLRDVH
jgi:ABC transport system ATP-binding/permease protein